MEVVSAGWGGGGGWWVVVVGGGVCECVCVHRGGQSYALGGGLDI